jgi:hypothetical protein
MDYTDDNKIEPEQTCPYLNRCPLLASQLDTLPTLVDRFKTNYCFKNHHVCARRWIHDFLGFEKVPDLMMPQQHDWAEQLLFEAGVSYKAFEQKYRVPLPCFEVKKAL